GSVERSGRRRRPESEWTPWTKGYVPERMLAVHGVVVDATEYACVNVVADSRKASRLGVRQPRLGPSTRSARSESTTRINAFCFMAPIRLSTVPSPRVVSLERVSALLQPPGRCGADAGRLRATVGLERPDGRARQRQE